MAEVNQPKPLKSKEKSNKFSKMLLLLLSCLSLGFLGGWVGSKAGNGNLGSLQNATPETRQEIVSSESELISSIAKEVSDSVVSINVSGVQTSFFFGSSEFAGAGTGIIVNKEGVILTNRHVVSQDVENITVILNDGTELPASVLARDTVNDIAFIKITDLKGEKLKPAKLGDSSSVEVGDKVVAIGNALGEFQNTVTTGIISGKGRPIVAYDGTAQGDALRNLLQTDAAINEGNSGGPLLNMNGEVIGINVAKSDSSSENIGFAIPINDVADLVKVVLEKGKIVRPYLGVRYVTLNKSIAKQYDLPVDQGAYVAPSFNQNGLASVLAGSPADKAGLAEEDIITEINGELLNEEASLVERLIKYNPGDSIELTILRDGKELKLNATLAESPSTSAN